MRLISVTLLLVSIALAGCQGGERISKAASAPSPGDSQQAGEEPLPSPDSKCMSKCRAKADDQHAKCAATGKADACNAAQIEDILECNEMCANR